MSITATPQELEEMLICTTRYYTGRMTAAAAAWAARLATRMAELNLAREQALKEMT